MNAVFQSFAGKPPNQLGIVVTDMDAAIARHTRLLGRDDWLVQDNTPATGMHGLHYREQPGTFSERVALIGTGPQLELIKPLTGPSVHLEWLEAGGTGIHHICFEVADIEAATAEMQANGYPCVQGGYGFLPDNTGGFGYFDTVADLSYMVELVQL